ncbi:minor capsid protein [Streptococcus gallolyticus]|uniref:Bacteriophage minor capsid protein n=1 Tax=Streptococcus gallolyticus TaxID=315405 RepID=A0A1H9V8Y6_9STRE|nr:minor capsid protein [Streptococcus gallolyticus]SES18162.1 bacteriophage minor capsid protein [Streptococcus gallolyticus]
MKQDNKNFQEVLLNYVNSFEELPLKARLDYFNESEDDLVINALPGGTIDREFMDGAREVSLPFEIAVKCKSNKKASDIIWFLNGELSDLGIELPSTDDSYIFLTLSVDKPGINGRDEQGYFVYTLQLTAKLEI